MTDHRYRTGIPRLPECEDAACNLVGGHLGEHEQRKAEPLVPDITEMSLSALQRRYRMNTSNAMQLQDDLRGLKDERKRHVERWYEQDQVIRELRSQQSFTHCRQCGHVEVK